MAGPPSSPRNLPGNGITRAAFGGAVSRGHVPAYLVGEMIGGLRGGAASVGIARVHAGAAPASRSPGVPGAEASIQEQRVSGAMS
jgi:hypothetical protein